MKLCTKSGLWARRSECLRSGQSPNTVSGATISELVFWLIKERFNALEHILPRLNEKIITICGYKYRIYGGHMCDFL